MLQLPVQRQQRQQLPSPYKSSSIPGKIVISRHNSKILSLRN